MTTFEFLHMDNQQVTDFTRQAPGMNLTTRFQHFHTLFPYAENLPANIWLQDSDGSILVCNNATFHALKGSVHEVIGRTILDIAERLHIPCVLLDKIQENNIKALNGETVIAHENVVEGDYEQVWLTKKTPIYHNESNNILGVLGVSLLAELKHLKIQWNSHRKQFMIFPTPEKHLAFSVREFAVLKDVLKGKTSFEIAKENNLSPKTIETYILRVKVKCDCTKTREVISYFINADLANEILNFSSPKYCN